MGKKLQFTELDQYLFGQGTHYDIYRKLGAHPDTQNRKKGVYFAVWAPNAQAVSVIGEFNGWNNEKNPMKKVGTIVFMRHLYLEPRSDNCINFTLRELMVKSFTRQTRMPMKLSCVQELHPGSQILPTINGKMLPG